MNNPNGGLESLGSLLSLTAEQAYISVAAGGTAYKFEIGKHLFDIHKAFEAELRFSPPSQMVSSQCPINPFGSERACLALMGMGRRAPQVHIRISGILCFMIHRGQVANNLLIFLFRNKGDEMYLKRFILLMLFLTMSCEGACRAGLGDECDQYPRSADGHGTFPLPQESRECEEGLTCQLKSIENGGVWKCDRPACDGLCDETEFCEFPAEVCRPRLKTGERCDDKRLQYKCNLELRCNQGFSPASCQSLQPAAGRCGEDKDCQTKGGCPMVCEQKRCLAQTCTKPKSDAGNLDIGTDGD